MPFDRAYCGLQIALEGYIYIAYGGEQDVTAVELRGCCVHVVCVHHSGVACVHARGTNYQKFGIQWGTPLKTIRCFWGGLEDLTRSIGLPRETEAALDWRGQQENTIPCSRQAHVFWPVTVRASEWTPNRVGTSDKLDMGG